MLALKLLLTVTGALLLAAALAIPLYSLFLRIQIMRKKMNNPDAIIEHEPIPWRGPATLALVACLPFLIAGSIVVVPSGMGGVRVSQIRGTLPGTLYPGVHFVTPLVDSVQIFDLRDHMFTAGLGQEGVKATAQKAGLDVQSREGLSIGLGVTVRYRFDPNKLASVESHLPQPADKELVPPVVASAWRRTGAAVHGARDLLKQARRGAR